MISLVVLIGWWTIGAYVIWSAEHNGYVSMMGDGIWGWIFGAAVWPWVLIHVREAKKENARMRPFEDWVKKYDQEQVDKRLDELKREE